MKALYIDSSTVMKLVGEETESQEPQQFIAGKNPEGRQYQAHINPPTKVEAIQTRVHLDSGTP